MEIPMMRKRRVRVSLKITFRAVTKAEKPPNTAAPTGDTARNMGRKINLVILKRISRDSRVSNCTHLTTENLPIICWIGQMTSALS